MTKIFNNNAITATVNTIQEGGKLLTEAVDTSISSTSTYFDGSERMKGSETDPIEMLANMQIGGFCNFNDKMGEFMTRLMKINLHEHDITLNNITKGSYIDGDSDSLNAHVVRNYSYTKGNNYIDFVKDVKVQETYGIDATRSYKKDDVYVTTTNLYPDDIEGAGSNDFRGSDKWTVKNKDSILYKTKELFKQKKINTIISRFGTNADGRSTNVDYKGSNRTVGYGESHGRNLLKKGAEKGGGSYNINGYNNPYCRVWTHHYRYDRMNKTLRPLNGGEINIADFHNWSKTVSDFNQSNLQTKGNQTSFEVEYISEAQKAKYGKNWRLYTTKKTATGRVVYEDVKENTSWKSGDIGWEYSVLDTSKGGDGLLRIAPKFSAKGGGKDGSLNNIHTKDCMFSIENLAWKGYDPYSFETALSWEQRGPLGGRIMWFPPYGIQFSENTNVNWSKNTFIGRGEDVYTYVNTQRSGNLSFLMVVDHPSIIDYTIWHDQNLKATDNDVHRFFAGCDEGSGDDSLVANVKPTPLTDEGVKIEIDEKDLGYDEEYKGNNDDNGNKDTEKTNIKVRVMAFFPNNYSGSYDDWAYTFGYLLMGKNTWTGFNQKEGDNFPYIGYSLFREDNITQWTWNGNERIDQERTLKVDFKEVFLNGKFELFENADEKKDESGNWVTKLYEEGEYKGKPLYYLEEGKDQRGYECNKEDGGVTNIDKNGICTGGSGRDMPCDSVIYAYRLPFEDAFNQYVKDGKKGVMWQYRVDGQYVQETDTKNTYAQRIPDKDGNNVQPNDNYKDLTNFKLNLTTENWGEFKDTTDIYEPYMIEDPFSAVSRKECAIDPFNGNIPYGSRIKNCLDYIYYRYGKDVIRGYYDNVIDLNLNKIDDEFKFNGSEQLLFVFDNARLDFNDNDELGYVEFSNPYLVTGSEDSVKFDLEEITLPFLKKLYGEPEVEQDGKNIFYLWKRSCNDVIRLGKIFEDDKIFVVLIYNGLDDSENHNLVVNLKPKENGTYVGTDNRDDSFWENYPEESNINLSTIQGIDAFLSDRNKKLPLENEHVKFIGSENDKNSWRVLMDFAKDERDFTLAGGGDYGEGVVLMPRFKNEANKIQIFNPSDGEHIVSVYKDSNTEIGNFLKAVEACGFTIKCFPRANQIEDKNYIFQCRAQVKKEEDCNDRTVDDWKHLIENAERSHIEIENNDKISSISSDIGTDGYGKYNKLTIKYSASDEDDQVSYYFYFDDENKVYKITEQFGTDPTAYELKRKVYTYVYLILQPNEGVKIYKRDVANTKASFNSKSEEDNSEPSFTNEEYNEEENVNKEISLEREEKLEPSDIYCSLNDFVAAMDAELFTQVDEAFPLSGLTSSEPFTVKGPDITLADGTVIPGKEQTVELTNPTLNRTTYNLNKEKSKRNYFYARSENKPLIKQLWELFKTGKLVNVECIGFSNSHGSATPGSNENNSNLSVTRATRLNELIAAKFGYRGTVRSQSGMFVSDYDHNSLSSKLWRSAMATLTFEVSKKQSVASSHEGNNELISSNVNDDKRTSEQVFVNNNLNPSGVNGYSLAGDKQYPPVGNAGENGDDIKLETPSEIYAFLSGKTKPVDKGSKYKFFASIGKEGDEPSTNNEGTWTDNIPGWQLNSLGSTSKYPFVQVGYRIGWNKRNLLVGTNGTNGIINKDCGDIRNELANIANGNINKNNWNFYPIARMIDEHKIAYRKIYDFKGMGNYTTYKGENINDCNFALARNGIIDNDWVFQKDPLKLKGKIHTDLTYLGDDESEYIDVSGSTVEECLDYTVWHLFDKEIAVSESETLGSKWIDPTLDNDSNSRYLLRSKMLSEDDFKKVWEKCFKNKGFLKDKDETTQTKHCEDYYRRYQARVNYVKGYAECLYMKVPCGIKKYRDGDIVDVFHYEASKYPEWFDGGVEGKIEDIKDTNKLGDDIVAGEGGILEIFLRSSEMFISSGNRIPTKANTNANTRNIKKNNSSKNNRGSSSSNSFCNWTPDQNATKFEINPFQLKDIANEVKNDAAYIAWTNTWFNIATESCTGGLQNDNGCKASNVKKFWPNKKWDLHVGCKNKGTVKMHYATTRSQSYKNYVAWHRVDPDFKSPGAKNCGYLRFVVDAKLAGGSCLISNGLNWGNMWAKANSYGNYECSWAFKCNAGPSFTNPEPFPSRNKSNCWECIVGKDSTGVTRVEYNTVYKKYCKTSENESKPKTDPQPTNTTFYDGNAYSEETATTTTTTQQPEASTQVTQDNEENERLAREAAEREAQKQRDEARDAARLNAYRSSKMREEQRRQKFEEAEGKRREEARYEDWKREHLIKLITAYDLRADRQGNGDKNVLRYDQEYYFFKSLEKKDKIVYDKLMDKIKYFDPAFHSMTPEGFNARLTFLNQCTRQGNTISISDQNNTEEGSVDKGVKTANNLAFGRPPYCVLRLGDFYNQMIVINSINIDYSVSDGVQWDMNMEGIGMQPLLARVDINFNFIGGGDMAGPVRRLQNAMSFNYYANARYYDNRADRMAYPANTNTLEMGAIEYQPDIDNSRAHVTAMRK